MSRSGSGARAGNIRPQERRLAEMLISPLFEPHIRITPFFLEDSEPPRLVFVGWEIWESPEKPTACGSEDSLQAAALAATNRRGLCLPVRRALVDGTYLRDQAVI